MIPGPPPPPASSAAAEASWASWKAERSAVARLKRTCASTSSCGSGGSEEKVISGAETRPSTVTMAVTSCERVSATKWICGSRLPTSCSEPSSKSMRWPRIRMRPRRRSNWPTGWMSVLVPRTVICPPISTSRPRPRTKIWFGALIRTSRPMPARSLGSRGARRADVGAVERRLHRRRGVDVASPGRARPGRWRRAPRPPRSRCGRCRCGPASMPPPPTSGPSRVRSPESRVATKTPSV